jgi:hypothetical protein
MKKLFHFDSPREPYECDAAVVWCFDHRFQVGFRKFLKRIGVVVTDSIQVAGGARCLASPELERDRDFVLDQIRTSIRLHAARRVVLMVHSDCGGYGGLAAFGGDSDREARHHIRELRRAADALSKAIPGLQIDGYFINFEGVWAPGTVISAAGQV